MTLRELPVNEWPKLRDWELNLVLPFASPEFARVLVVEDEHGEIIGAEAFLSFIHWEGGEVRTDHRGKGAVLRLLLSALTDGTVGADGVMTGAASPEIEAQMKRLGAVELGTKTFYLPLTTVKSALTEEA